MNTLPFTSGRVKSPYLTTVEASALGGLVLDVFDAIKLRRSVRSFTEEEVSDDEVKMLLEAARWAPSAGNIQPWSFIVVRTREMKKRLTKAALDQLFIEEAPVVIVVCADQHRSGMGYGSRGVNLYCIQDTAAATQNILLGACALGLGGCWVGAFNENLVTEALNLPREVRPVALVPIGHPAETPQPRYKRPLREILRHETF